MEMLLWYDAMKSAIDDMQERSEGRQRKTTISRLEKMLTRRHSRSRDREQGIQKRQSPENRPHEELIETHSDQVLFGMDEEQHIKVSIPLSTKLIIIDGREIRARASARSILDGLDRGDDERSC